MITGIYTITNIINNKIYVGKSKNIKYRFTEHLKCLENNKHHNIYLQNAFNKYGKEAFKLEILEECDITFIFSQENYWCNLLNVHNRNYGYNIAPTSPNGLSKLAKETILKLSKASSSWKRSKEICKLISLSKKGKRLHDDSLKAARLSVIKSINQYDRNMNYICSYESIEEASKILNINKGNIQSVCCSRRKTAGNYIFKYK